MAILRDRELPVPSNTYIGGSWIYLCKAEIVPATCRLPVTQALGLTLPSHVANEGKIMEFAEECPNLDELGVRLHRGSWRRALSVRLVV